VTGISEPPKATSLEDFLPVTQENVHAAFDLVFAPWIKEMGFTDIEARQGFCAMRLPLNDRLKFFSGAVCGQALMAAIDTVASVAVMTTTPRTPKGTVYQHTHFLRPAANDDFRIEAIVRRSGKASAYVECSVTFAASGDLATHAVLEFAL
jgi:acyl-coenzyme A thioesterase PaaI-like protein